MDRDRFRSIAGQGRTPSTDGVAATRPMRQAPYTTPRRMPAQPVAPTQPVSQAPLSQSMPVNRQPIAPNPLTPHQPTLRQQPVPVASAPFAQTMGAVAVQEPQFVPAQAAYVQQPASIQQNNLRKLPSVSLPSISLPSIHLPKPVIISVIAVVSLSVIGGGAFALLGTGSTKADSQNEARTSTPSNSKTIGVVAADKPSFKPLAPVDKQILAKGGAGTQYDSTHAAYTYNDQVRGNKISVTQMMPPSNYASAQDAADKTAVKLMADARIPNKFGTAHIISKDPDGNQDIIAPVNGILVLIQSPTTQSQDQWKSYIESLQ